MKQIKNKIDKKFILSNVNQIEVFAKYLNIDQTDIEDCVVHNSLIPSPIRPDNNPSVGFRFNNKGVLKMRDFGGYFWGDCFDVVAYVLSTRGNRINITNGEHFKFVINHIATTFDMINGVSEKDDLPSLIRAARRTKKLITFQPRSWDSHDKKIWVDKYHKLFTFDFLSKNYVYPVELFWIDAHTQPEPKYYYTKKDPCYAYYLGQDKSKISNIRLYFPNRSKDPRFPKFISNNNSFQGIIDIENKYDAICLIKSYKDALAMRRLFDTLFSTGILKVLFIGYPAETFVLTEDIYKWLLTKLRVPSSKNIINFVDFDKTGRRLAKHGSDTFGIKYVFLTNGEFGLHNYGAKDITDYIERYGINASFNLINKFIQTIYERIETTSDSDETHAPF
jgi:hypothetical protein